MASNPVVNTLTFAGSVAGQASISAQGIAGGLTLLLPNLVPVQGQLLTASSINGNNVFLGWSSSQSLSNIPLSALAQSGATNGQFIEWNGTAWIPGTASGGTGTVTSVALTAPGSVFAVGGSPITTNGTLAITLQTQSPNQVWAGPTSGGAATPTFRSLVAADIGAGTVTIAAINSKRGNGGFVQLAASGTAGAAGDVVTFDANGNTVDSGTLLSSLAPLASPTFTGVVTIGAITLNAGSGAVNVSSIGGSTAEFGTFEIDNNLIIDSNATFNPTATLTDGAASVGTSGQVLTSNGTGVRWTGAPTLNSITAKSGVGLNISASGTDAVEISTATGVFQFFGTGGGMSLATQNSQIAIDVSGNISLSATGGSNIGIAAGGNLVTSSDFKPTNLFSFPGNTSGTAGQLFSSLGTDSGTAWISQSSLAIAGSQVTGNISGSAASITGTITSSQVSDGLQRVSVVLSSSDIANINATPFQILAAPGAGLFYSVAALSMSYRFGTVPFTVSDNTGDAYLSVTTDVANISSTYDAMSVSLAVNPTGLDLTASVSQTASSGGAFYGADTAANTVNQPLVLGVNGGPSTIGGAGDGTLKVVVYYTIETA